MLSASSATRFFSFCCMLRPKYECYRWSWPPLKISLFLKSFRSCFGPSKLLRCIYGCEKWIPDKIPHRNSYPKKISTFFSSKIKYFSKIKKMQNMNFEKYFCSFSKNIFFRRKKKVEKIFGLPFRCGILSGIHFWHP